jgi:hypothetical protein
MMLIIQTGLIDDIGLPLDVWDQQFFSLSSEGLIRSMVRYHEWGLRLAQFLPAITVRLA